MSKVQYQPKLIETMLSELQTAELENFGKIISTILANRKKNNRKGKEKELLLKINNCVLPDGHLERFLFLREKRQEKELPQKELTDFFQLIEKEQKLQFKRLKLLKKLADLRGISVPTLMNQLEITAPKSI